MNSFRFRNSLCIWKRRTLDAFDYLHLSTLADLILLVCAELRLECRAGHTYSKTDLIVLLQYTMISSTDNPEHLGTFKKYSPAGFGASLVQHGHPRSL